MKVLVVDKIHNSLHEMLDSAGFEVDDVGTLAAKDVLPLLRQYEGWVLRSKINIDRALISGNPQLKFVARAGAGIEHIDVNALKKAGVVIFSSPEGNRQAVAEHAMGMLLGLMHKIKTAANEVRSGVWNRTHNSGEELSEKTVGIIGYGNTGEAFARLLTGFGVRILVYDKYEEVLNTGHVSQSSMQEIHAHADVVSLHLPLADDTRFLVNKAWIEKFSKPFYLINTSRGKIVDTAAVFSGIGNGQILGACLDVVEFERDDLSMPAFTDLPPFFLEMIKDERVIFTPHIAGLSSQSYEKLSKVLAEKIITHFRHA